MKHNSRRNDREGIEAGWSLVRTGTKRAQARAQGPERVGRGTGALTGARMGYRYRGTDQNQNKQILPSSN